MQPNTIPTHFKIKNKNHRKNINKNKNIFLKHLSRFGRGGATAHDFFHANLSKTLLKRLTFSIAPKSQCFFLLSLRCSSSFDFNKQAMHRNKKLLICCLVHNCLNFHLCINNYISNESEWNSGQFVFEKFLNFERF